MSLRSVGRGHFDGQVIKQLDGLHQQAVKISIGEKLMIGLGTVINAAAIIVGGIIGLFGGKWLKPQIRETVTKATGVCVIFIGVAGVLEQMLTVEDGKLTAGGTTMLIVSIALGGLVGELLRIHLLMERFGEWLKQKSGNSKDDRFLDGFVTATMTVCIGAMAIVGAVKDGIYGDYSILTAKALLDFIIILIMASSLGVGCIFSAIPVVIFQGTFTVLAKLIEPLLTAEALSAISLVGSALIFCVGLNLIRKDTVRVANLLPSLVFAAAYALILG